MSDDAKTTIALVTGANRGIGKAVAIQLARDHGYHVVIGSRKLAAGEAVAAELQAAGHKASAVQLDLTSDDSMAAAVSTIESKFGRLDVLVNNAAVLLDKGGSGFKEMPDLSTRELFEKTFQTNVIGTACLTELALPMLRKATSSPGPRLVFVVSMMGSLKVATDPTTHHYALDYKAYDASKAAVNMLMINYARILKDVGGLVNSVCPGLVATAATGFTEWGTTAEVGAKRVVELATLGPGGPSGTFSDSRGEIAW
ncbi:NAD(P)-binding protein [Thozetella sp. PMI_491]|nr:NAD(P)-binding protein [Thozetella sp. PMI_491]